LLRGKTFEGADDWQLKEAPMPNDFAATNDQRVPGRNLANILETSAGARTPKETQIIGDCGWINLTVNPRKT
jgi:hypothetical protein